MHNTYTFEVCFTVAQHLYNKQIQCRPDIASLTDNISSNPSASIFQFCEDPDSKDMDAECDALNALFPHIFHILNIV